MEVQAHPDPFVLENALLARISTAQSDDPLTPVLVVVPSGRLAKHVERRIAERHGARLNVHVLHYHALISRILAADAAGPRRTMSRRLREAMLEAVLDEHSDELWSRFVRRRPGALDGLMEAVKDLREAGLTADQVSATLRDGERELSLGRIYSAYVETLERVLEEHGLADDTLRAREAAGCAERFASGFRAVIHHGAYELIGRNLDVLRALDRGTTVTFLLPAAPGAPAGVYAERFAKRFLLEPGSDLGRVGETAGGLMGSRLAALYDESAEPEPVEGDRVVFRNAQGDRAEIAIATRRALGAVAADNPPWENAIVARSLSPFAASIQAVAQETDASWSTSARVPLRRHPAVHDLLVTFRVVVDDFPRAGSVEVLRSPRIRWDALGVAPPLGDLAESWSRKAKVVGGLDAWLDDLPSWADEPEWRSTDTDDEDERARQEKRRREKRRQAERFGRALKALNDRIDPDTARSWRAHAERVVKFVAEVLPGEDFDTTDAAMRELESILDDMAELDVLRAGDGDVRFAEMARWLERTIDRSEIDLEERDEGGVRILDFMQARGLTFSRLWIVGMNERLFPRVSREDPFLPDAARRRLIEAAGRPLPLTAEADEQEHLLLSLMLGSARDHLEVSWQRADDTGKSRTPSLALREVARLVRGAPELGELVERATRMSSHPRRWRDALVEETGMLGAREEETLIALRGESPEAALPLLGSHSDGLRRALGMLSATESFAPENFDYDGRIGGDGFSPKHYSATSMEALGRCPLQYFFRDVLRLRELDEEPSPYEVNALEMGQGVHDLLERLYGKLVEEGLLDADSAGPAIARAREILPAVWKETAGASERRVGSRLPLLGERVARDWTAALDEFVSGDLRRLIDDGLKVEKLEQFEERDIDLGEDTTIRLVGRFDRVASSANGPVVSDYKTSGDLSARANITTMLKADRLQVPLYWLLAERRGKIELLGAGPSYREAITEPADRRVDFDGFEDRRQEQGFLETVRTLARLVEAGTFPTHPDRHCTWCDYRTACRQKHPPTREREVVAPDSGDYRDLKKKNKSKKPLLVDTR